MLDLIAKNNEMLKSKSYKLADERTMLKISSLDNPNEYDLYLIACCLCNYPIEEKADARELRMKYFKATNNGQIDGFEHPITDYKKITTSVTCTNTGNVNKYGLYEYEININDRDMVSDFWAYKAKNCLKYVDSKTYDDKIVVSISRDQLDNFTKLLDTYMITYDLEDIEAGLFYKNKSANKLVDLSTLNLPFKPYPFQLEDAQKIVRKKRLLLGHDMGCFIGDTNIQLANGKYVKIKDLAKRPNYMFLVNSYDIKHHKFVTKYAVAHKTRQNAELVQVKYCMNNKYFDIYCTPDHKFLTIDNNWIEAKDLQPNTQLKSINNIIVIQVNNIDHKEDVYCLTVDDTHNFAIDNGIIVHNCGKTFISVLVGESIGTTENIMYSTTDNLDYNDIVITDKGPLPIGKIVEENIDCKVQVVKDGITKFVNILDRKSTDVL